MKYSFIVLVLLLAHQPSSAQNSRSVKFIQSIVQKEHILYTEKISDYLIKDLKDALNQDILCDWRTGLRYERHKIPDSLIFVLSTAEKEFISKELDKMKDVIWKDNLFENSFAISVERVKKYKDSHNGKLYYNPQDFKTVYTFSNPIFIRNSTICFLYFGSSDGGRLSIYIKNGDNWKIAYVPYTWIS